MVVLVRCGSVFGCLKLNELPTDDASGLDASLKIRIEQNNIHNTIIAPWSVAIIYECGQLSKPRVSDFGTNLRYPIYQQP